MEIHEGAMWKDVMSCSNGCHPRSLPLQVKKNLTHDPRYDAVGSSSLREELFNTFLKGNIQMVPLPSKGEVAPSETTASTRQEKKERAVRDREQKVKAEFSRVERNIEQSRMGINQEEGEREYKCAVHFCDGFSGGSKLTLIF